MSDVGSLYLQEGLLNAGYIFLFCAGRERRFSSVGARPSGTCRTILTGRRFVSHVVLLY